MRRRELLSEKLWRYRGVLLVAAVPVLLILGVVLFIPRPGSLLVGGTASQQHAHHTKPGAAAGISSGSSTHNVQYNIVLDAGSTGSRVHVFKFEGSGPSLKLISDTFKQRKPGLSAYRDDPAAAAKSLQELLDVATKTVPKALQPSTGLMLKATAGLRMLPGDAADRILKEVERYLRAHTPFKLRPDAVEIMDGAHEGAFAWLTLNYLLGHLGGAVERTVAAIDLGGGSVQEAFALPDEDVQHAPEGYVTQLKASGVSYNVYVHSYLGYGLMAARARIIDEGADEASGHPCFTLGHTGNYTYGDKQHMIRTPNAQGSFETCVAVTLEALDADKDCGAPKEQCSFNGGWRGKPSIKKRVYYVSSYFWDRAQEAGIISEKEAVQWTTSPAEFAKTGRSICGKQLTDLSKLFPAVKADQAPYFCVDLSFCYIVLTKGFRIDDKDKVTLVKQIKYNGQPIEAAWPLGAAINDLS